jgi:hypothetical protein
MDILIILLLLQLMQQTIFADIRIEQKTQHLPRKIMGLEINRMQR